MVCTSVFLVGYSIFQGDLVVCGRAMDLAIHRSRVRVSAEHHCAGTWASYLHLCASVTKQYDLVPAKGAISLAGKVSAGLVESTVMSTNHRVYH